MRKINSKLRFTYFDHNHLERIIPSFLFNHSSTMLAWLDIRLGFNRHVIACTRLHTCLLLLTKGWSYARLYIRRVVANGHSLMLLKKTKYSQYFHKNRQENTLENSYLIQALKYQNFGSKKKDEQNQYFFKQIQFTLLNS